MAVLLRFMRRPNIVFSVRRKKIYVVAKCAGSKL